MSNLYLDYLNDINKKLIRHGIRLPVDLSVDNTHIFSQIGILESFLYFNSLLGVCDSGYKISSLACEMEGSYLDWLKDEIKSEYEEIWEQELSRLVEQPPNAGVVEGEYEVLDTKVSLSVNSEDVKVYNKSDAITRFQNLLGIDGGSYSLDVDDYDEDEEVVEGDYSDDYSVEEEDYGDYSSEDDEDSVEDDYSTQEDEDIYEYDDYLSEDDEIVEDKEEYLSDDDENLEDDYNSYDSGEFPEENQESYEEEEDDYDSIEELYNSDEDDDVYLDDEETSDDDEDYGDDYNSDVSDDEDDYSSEEEEYDSYSEEEDYGDYSSDEEEEDSLDDDYGNYSSDEDDSYSDDNDNYSSDESEDDDDYGDYSSEDDDYGDYSSEDDDYSSDDGDEYSDDYDDYSDIGNNIQNSQILGIEPSRNGNTIKSGGTQSQHKYQRDAEKELADNLVKGVNSLISFGKRKFNTQTNSNGKR